MAPESRPRLAHDCSNERGDCRIFHGPLRESYPVSLSLPGGIAAKHCQRSCTSCRNSGRGNAPRAIRRDSTYRQARCRNRQIGPGVLGPTNDRAAMLHRQRRAPRSMRMADLTLRASLFTRIACTGVDAGETSVPQTAAIIDGSWAHRRRFSRIFCRTVQRCLYHFSHDRIIGKCGPDRRLPISSMGPLQCIGRITGSFLHCAPIAFSPRKGVNCRNEWYDLNHPTYSAHRLRGHLYG